MRGRGKALSAGRARFWGARIIQCACGGGCFFTKGKLIIRVALVTRDRLYTSVSQRHVEAEFRMCRRVKTESKSWCEHLA